MKVSFSPLLVQRANDFFAGGLALAAGDRGASRRTYTTDYSDVLQQNLDTTLNMHIAFSDGREHLCLNYLLIHTSKELLFRCIMNKKKQIFGDSYFDKSKTNQKEV
ncbi:MAG: hypothetical protein KF698_10370 [Anaerolineales bacterium]|nr:hypothetical protein [Anaerolineales bacterium]